LIVNENYLIATFCNVRSYWSELDILTSFRCQCGTRGRNNR